MTEWTIQDRELWRKYLADTDSKILKMAKLAIPRVSAKSFEEAALNASRKQGAEDILEIFDQAAEIQKPRIETNPFVNTNVAIPK